MQNIKAYLLLFLLSVGITSNAQTGSWFPTSYSANDGHIGKFFYIDTVLIFQRMSPTWEYGHYEISTDYGDTWDSLETDILRDDNFRLELTYGNVAIAKNGNSIIRTTNNFVTYDTVLTNIGDGGVIKLNNGDFLANENGFIVKSTDFGINWTPTATQFIIPAGKSKIVAESGRIICATSTGLLFSDDNGISFNILNTNLPNSINPENLNFYSAGFEMFVWETDSLKLYHSNLGSNYVNWFTQQFNNIDFSNSTPNSTIKDICQIGSGVLLSISGLPIYTRWGDGPSWLQMVSGTPYLTQNPPGLFSNFVLTNSIDSMESYIDTIYVAYESSDGIQIYKLAGTAIGIKDNLANLTPVNAFPNPSTDIMTIALPLGSTKVDYKIFNYMGAEVLSKTETTDGKLKIDLNSLSQGQYILVGTANGKAFKKTISKM